MVANGICPRHIAFILDGNRRFAKKHALQPWKGHDLGKKKVEELLKWCKELGVVEVTVFAFSLQNFKRSQLEVDHLMRLFLGACKELAESDDPDASQMRVRFIGRRHLLPSSVVEQLELVEQRTRDKGPFILNVAMAYGGREELVDAIRALACDVKSGEVDPAAIDESTIDEYMQLKSEPDMVIRTSGEQRTSNFLIWQSWYSEWFFIDKLWPEFEKEDLLRCVDEFKCRDRRFGGNGKK